MVKVGDSEVKEGLYYSKDYFWVKVEGEKVRCGLSDYAQKMMKHIVYADLPSANTEITMNEVCGSVESIKAVSDLVAPLTGKVVETNKALESESGSINEDPYGKGWMFIVEPSNLKSDLANLMDFNKAVEWHKTLK